MRIFICALILLMPGFNAQANTQTTTATQIRAAASQFLEAFASQQAKEGYTVSHETGAIDSRLSLASCDQLLTTEFTGNPWKSTHPSLQITCDGERPWRMFVSTTILIDGPALVAARALTRGERITENMVVMGSVTINASRQGVLKRMDDVLGMELRRPVNRGSLITPNLLTAPDAVVRGDHVIITASGGTFSISTRGIALANVSIGEQVMVENLQSSRAVKGYVVAPGRVEIPM
jgi:flagella basal body P-ring formation protein FlgA